MSFIIYQAGPLFSQAEREFHTKLKLELQKAGHDVIWPGELLTLESISDAGSGATQLIFNTCRSAIDGCTCVVALLDGTQVDDGTAWEIGYAYAKGLPIYGLRTDMRQGGDTQYNRVNSMVEGCLQGLALNTHNLVGMLGKG